MVKKFLKRENNTWDLTEGVMGPPGPIGLQGLTGPTGPTGPTGAAGSLTGPAGGDLGGNYPNPIVNQSSVNQFQFLGPEILYAGGLDGGGGVLPQTDSIRAGIQTIDATTQTLASITPNDGYMIRVLSEVHAVRKDVTGDAAWFILKGVWLRTGGSVVVVKAPSIVDSGSTAGASSWTADLSVNILFTGPVILTEVTGQSGATIHWSLVREYIEVT